MDQNHREQLARKLLLPEYTEAPINESLEKDDFEEYIYIQGSTLKISPKWDGRFIYKGIKSISASPDFGTAPGVLPTCRKTFEFKHLIIQYSNLIAPGKEPETKTDREHIAKQMLLACPHAKLTRQCIGEWGVEVYEYDNGQKITISPYWDGSLINMFKNLFSYPTDDQHQNNFISGLYNQATNDHIEESWNNIKLTTHIQGLLKYFQKRIISGYIKMPNHTNEPAQ